MTFSMFITRDAMQINLTPENDHERRFVGILESTDGDVSLHKGVNIAESHGGYYRNYGDSATSVCITIKNPVEKDPLL